MTEKAAESTPKTPEEEKTTSTAKASEKANTKPVFKGPNGAMFVPARTVSPRTIAARVKAGLWTPTNPPAKTLAQKSATAAAKLKAPKNES